MDALKREVEHILSSVEGRASVVIKNKKAGIAINGSERTSAASTIKIPIIMEAFRQAENGDLDLREKVQLASDLKTGGDGVLKLLENNLSLSILDLMKLMIVVSDNTASNLLVTRFGFSNVNHLCEQLGCTNTRLNRYFMDFEARDSGVDNTTSAWDMVEFLSEMEHGKFLSERSRQSIYNILREQQFTSGLPAYNKDEDVLTANKPGMLPGVQHDVGIFKYKDETVYAAVLLSELNDEEAGRRAIADIGRGIMGFMSKGNN
ncbi:serine hydrolase [Halobacillus mangrovi]|uniref:serine hydrolase n=1 Tax=Halobacillus mangrovi TaxID=402384 RepID=UPI003D982163